MSGLDDVKETVIYIPFNPDHEEGLDNTALSLSQNERDLLNGPAIRFEAYRVAWTKCLKRIQEIVQELCKPSVKATVDEIHSPSSHYLPGLPYRELPVLTIINPSFGSTFLQSVSSKLDLTGEETTTHPSVRTRTTHFYPSDFPNVMTGMKAIISSFVDGDSDLEAVKRKPATSVAPYDIQYFLAWYKAYCQAQDPEGEDTFNFVVMLHNFEQFDSSVMQDIFYIFASEASRLPMTFLLSLSAPSPDFLLIVYPRATLALLRVHEIVVPSGRRVLREILCKTFFDPKFEPDLVLGATALEFIVDYFTRFNGNMDALLNAVQLVHLKHFSNEPLTALACSIPSVESLSHSTSRPFMDVLQARLDSSRALSKRMMRIDVPDMIDGLTTLKEKFRLASRNLSIGFGVVSVLQSFFEKRGYKGLGWSSDPRKDGLIYAVVNIHRRGFEKETKDLAMLVRKFNEEELRSALDSLYQHFHNMPSHLRTAENAARTRIVQVRSLTSIDGDQIKEFARWLSEYLDDKLAPLEEVDLWDIWYTGASPAPSELLNPSIRASIISGLLRPHEFCESYSSEVEKGLWELPDTSILFKRYLDSGKMINVYDWFDSFKGVLDTQRSNLREKGNAIASPMKKGKGRRKKSAALPPPSEEEDEQWKLEVQARFIRALHELDYLGFIKHTGRKADHVLRTVFDVDDAE